jgi:hypothetical protein
MFWIASCSNDSAPVSSQLNEEDLIPRSTYSEIMSNGVSSPSDFDVLRSNNEYPFDTLSSTDFSDYKDSTTFINDTLVGDRFGLHNYLTVNQYKIWFQVATHSNISLGIYPPGHFLDDVSGERQYQDKTGLPSGLVLPQNKAVMVEDLKDCPIGDGGCWSPL